MSLVVFLTIPGLAIALILLASVDGLGMWLNRRVALPWRTNASRVDVDRGTAIIRLPRSTGPSLKHVNKTISDGL